MFALLKCDMDTSTYLMQDTPSFQRSLGVMQALIIHAYDTMRACQTRAKRDVTVRPKQTNSCVQVSCPRRNRVGLY